ncbi:hypothetical protein SISSUDRAFT_1113206 [Sistotremastrum suecicum HHB10207 ss-3]|uniref:Fatty acid desaturase domain-containing protein n=1 Tax=Sistotremastrum suecicum HHB10207 ss-3 TaxID=1314776 RepID=A0A166FT97_9AGAM|nr:hypothetical protein SISSUDRAFT_1113206 [Sistotremastrum suecicum HHB10207 ss-3]
MVLFKDSPEYVARKNNKFEPVNVTFKEIHSAVPKEIFVRNSAWGLYYWGRDVAQSLLFWYLATYIDPFAASPAVAAYGKTAQFAVKWGLWATYWWWQSLTWGGMWCLGHEAGHETLSPHTLVNQFIGFTLHSWILVPFYSWKYSHAIHHKATGHMDKDEIYVPYVRQDFKLPPEQVATKRDYMEVFEEAPIVALARLIIMQTLGYQLYLTLNTMGSPMYPPGTNHFEPESPIFKKEQRRMVVLSDIGVGAVAAILAYATYKSSLSAFIKYYLVTYFLANHWVVLTTFLQHSDPTLPHYRSGEWNFIRGANATVDRPVLGWIGRFFLHNVSHDHVAHHYFSRVPFYNQPTTTKVLKEVLGDHYNYDSTNCFYALWRSFNECQFVEPEGDIVFYKNKNGVVAREVSPTMKSLKAVPPAVTERPELVAHLTEM